jgi:hypothetical protein
VFEEGNIIYFTPFFPNGKSAPKSKYCIIIKSLIGKTIIAILPTSKNNIPLGISIATGCIDEPVINLNAFVFEANTHITTCNKGFNFNTFVYGHQIEYYSVDLFTDLYRIEKIDFEIFGKLKPQIYQQLITCLKNSKSVKLKFVRDL